MTKRQFFVRKPLRRAGRGEEKEETLTQVRAVVKGNQEKACTRATAVVSCRTFVHPQANEDEWT